MYKSFKTKKYYLAFHKFPKTAKLTPTKFKCYNTGFRKWKSYNNSNTYALVIWTFRIMFTINKPEIGTCNG